MTSSQTQADGAWKIDVGSVTTDDLALYRKAEARRPAPLREAHEFRIDDVPGAPGNRLDLSEPVRVWCMRTARRLFLQWVYAQPGDASVNALKYERLQPWATAEVATVRLVHSFDSLLASVESITYSRYLEERWVDALVCHLQPAPDDRIAWYLSIESSMALMRLSFVIGDLTTTEVWDGASAAEHGFAAATARTPAVVQELDYISPLNVLWATRPGSLLPLLSSGSGIWLVHASAAISAMMFEAVASRGTDHLASGMPASGWIRARAHRIVWEAMRSQLNREAGVPDRPAVTFLPFSSS